MTDERISTIASMYNERSDGYDQSHHAQQAKDVLKLARIQPGEHVLDLACGTGLVTVLEKEAAGPTGRVVGVDVADDMIAKGREKALASNLDISWYNCNIADLSSLDLIPGNGKKFDVITCVAALVLLNDAKAAIEHWKTFLRPGGRIIVDVPTETSQHAGAIIEKVGKQLAGSNLVPYDRDWVTSQETYHKLLTDSGLVVEKLEVSDAYTVEEVDAGDANAVFEKTISNPVFRAFQKPDILEEARSLFVKEWEARIGSSGKVQSEARLYVAVARVP